MTSNYPPESKSYPIRDIFQTFGPAYVRNHDVPALKRTVINCIADCKTGNLGYNVSYCEDCNYAVMRPCSCNNRNCPNCQASNADKWVLERNSELIEGIAYYHVVFTIPSELYSLVYANQKSLYQLMFKSAADTLLSLSKDKKYLGATPGIMMVLHTAGSAMNYHPHIHACISGGGLTKANQFA